MENFPGEGWANFFAAETGAAATLSGLVFVAMSINLSRILAFPHLPRRAAETLALLVGALVVCSIGLVPGQSGAVVGTEYIVVGFVAWLFPTANLVRSFRLERLAPVWRLSASALFSQAGTLPYMVAGAAILTGHPSGLYWLVVGVLFAFLAAVLSAWVLLVEIMR